MIETILLLIYNQYLMHNPVAGLGCKVQRVVPCRKLSSGLRALKGPSQSGRAGPWRLLHLQHRPRQVHHGANLLSQQECKWGVKRTG